MIAIPKRSTPLAVAGALFAAGLAALCGYVIGQAPGVSGRADAATPVEVGKPLLVEVGKLPATAPLPADPKLVAVKSPEPAKKKKAQAKRRTTTTVRAPPPVAVAPAPRAVPRPAASAPSSSASSAPSTSRQPAAKQEPKVSSGSGSGSVETTVERRAPAPA